MGEMEKGGGDIIRKWLIEKKGLNQTFLKLMII